MADADREKALRSAVLSAIRAWTYDSDERTVADLKGENGHTYGVQIDLMNRIVAAVLKLDLPATGPAN